MICISESQKGQVEPDKEAHQEVEVGGTTQEGSALKGKYWTFQTIR